jgi:hypothetical protein
MQSKVTLSGHIDVLFLLFCRSAAQSVLIQSHSSGSEDRGDAKGRRYVKKLIAAAAAAALVISPTVAAAQSAPVEVAPATEQVEGEQIRGGFILPLAIIVAAIIAVYLLTKGDDDDNVPPSP